MSKDSFGYKIFKAILTVLAIVAIILTFGWLISDEEVQPKLASANNDENKKLIDPEEEKKKLKTQLNTTLERIKFIEDRKIEIEHREKRFLIASRVVLGLILIALNIVYVYFFNLSFKFDSQLNLNEAILLVYSFFAFLTYGTPTKFVTAIKSKIAYMLKKKHIDVIEELEPLKLEKDRLIKEIEKLN